MVEMSTPLTPGVIAYRALLDTWVAVRAHVAKTAFTGMFFAFGTPILWYFAGGQAVVNGTWSFASAGVAGVAIFACLIFFWNLWLTPYRLISEHEVGSIREELRSRTFTPERLEAVEARALNARDNAMRSLDVAPRIERIQTDLEMLNAIARLEVFQQAAPSFRRMLAESGEARGIHERLNMFLLWPNKMQLADGDNLAARLDATEAALKAAVHEQAAAIVKRIADRP